MAQQSCNALRNNLSVRFDHGEIEGLGQQWDVTKALVDL
jgi:hypothetical protein